MEPNLTLSRLRRPVRWALGLLLGTALAFATVLAFFASRARPA